MTRYTVPLPRAPREPLRRVLARPIRGAVSAVRRLAFWAAVVLPLLYIPLLTGAGDDRRLLALGALVAVNVCCLLVGHDYSP